MTDTKFMAGITYVHPSISSTITDNSATYVTADGTTKLFAVFTSYKGRDNVIRTITSVTEYIFNYGEPNIKKYGQVGYNVINWLNAGGVVYALRVLPENAGYANAIVNIQTKVGGKQVLNNAGVLVEVPDVSVRHTVTSTNVNNTSESSIKNELDKETDVTSDGYKNNKLFAVIPKGRGEGYNNLGFKLSLITAYDSTYDFRLYNFEVTQVSDSGSISTIQGPFVVALDPDALSLSGESLFIETVVSKYCDYFTVVFNEKNYEALGEIINPHVNPNRIDFFSGVTKVIDGVEETYFEPLTQKDENVHLYVTKYTDAGEATAMRNFVDADDVIEGEIVNYDNTYRKSIYDRASNTFDNLKIALNCVKKGSSLENPIYAELNYLKSDGSFQEAYNKLKDDNDNFPGNQTDENFDTLNKSVSNIETLFDTELNNAYKVFDMSKISGTSDDSIVINVNLKKVESEIFSVKNVSIKFANLTSKLVDLKAELDSAKNNNLLSSDEVILFADIINETDEILDVIKNNSISYFSGPKIETADTDFGKLVENYNNLIDEYIIAEEYEKATKDAYTNSEKLIASLEDAIKYVLVEVKANKYVDLASTLVDTKQKIVQLFDGTVNSIQNNEISVEDILVIIENYKTTLNNALQNTYNTVLQNFDNNVKLRFGNDGDITDKLYSSSEVEKLIIKGYTGIIDNRLLDKSVFPIDVVLDANYSVNVKNAIVTLTTEIRNDFVAMLDTKCQATPEQAIAFRRSSLSVNNFRLSIWAQDFIVNDSAYTGLNMQVTAPYFLSSKIPSNDNANGIHWNFVGPRRGTISGFESISYLPNPEWKEQMYNAQINYVEQDLSSTRFGSQLTSQTIVSALSNVNNVRTLLRIQRDVEELMADYQFEYNDNTTRSHAQLALNAYLNQWVTNRACDSISGSVYASDYDRAAKILRVKVEMVFNSIIERIAIDLIVNS